MLRIEGLVFAVYTVYILYSLNECQVPERAGSQLLPHQQRVPGQVAVPQLGAGGGGAQRSAHPQARQCRGRLGDCGPLCHGENNF